MSEIKLKDRSMAQLIHAVSYATNKSSVLRRHITEPEEHVNSYVNVLWSPAHMAADTITNWIEFPGDPESGRLPRSYRKYGAVAVNRREIDEKRRLGCIPAVAFAVGSYAVVGISRTEELFGEDPSMLSRYAVAARTGRDPLKLSAGILSPNGIYIPAENLYQLSPLPTPIKGTNILMPLV